MEFERKTQCSATGGLGVSAEKGDWIRTGGGEEVVPSKPRVRESRRCPKEGDRRRKKGKGCSFRVVSRLSVEGLHQLQGMGVREESAQLSKGEVTPVGRCPLFISSFWLQAVPLRL